MGTGLQVSGIWLFVMVVIVAGIRCGTRERQAWHETPWRRIGSGQPTDPALANQLLPASAVGRRQPRRDLRAGCRWRAPWWPRWRRLMHRLMHRLGTRHRSELSGARHPGALSDRRQRGNAVNGFPILALLRL